MSGIESVTKAVEAAAQQNDRYLFLFALVIIMAGGGLVIRWLVNKYDKAEIRSQADRDAYQRGLTDLVTKGFEVTQKLVLATESNSRVIEENTAELKKRRRELNEQ
jgi:hypothetical protein